MNRRIKLGVAALLIFLLILLGCRNTSEYRSNNYTKHTETFYDTFDTLVQVVAYTKSEQEFALYSEIIYNRFKELHKLYDKYNSYDNINNIKTINDNAGIKAVKVEKEIIDLILFAKKWYGLTKGRTNIALGPVLEIWHDYRDKGNYSPENAALPPMVKLNEAAEKTDIEKVIVDTEHSTVYLAEKGMSLDVGAVAKGFAVELAAQEVIAKGMESGIISAGGNIRTIGNPLDGVRERWGIGIQDPNAPIISDRQKLIDTIFVSDASIVSSGDYQRYYIVDGEVLHHIIDPDTLMPAQHYRSVTVVTENSGVADFLSTELFILPYVESNALAEDLEGVDALWVMPNGEVRVTSGMRNMLKSFGVSNEKKG